MSSFWKAMSQLRKYCEFYFLYQNDTDEMYLLDKPRSAGRGNAHERSNKYFTPGLLKILREKGGLGNSVLPFWTVFQGDITRDPCRVREITCWYADHTEHYFMWRNSSDPKPLIEHFDKSLKQFF